MGAFFKIVAFALFAASMLYIQNNIEYGKLVFNAVACICMWCTMFNE